MTTTNLEQLSGRIEQVIHEHILARERAAADAVARAFARESATRHTRRVVGPPEGGKKRRAATEIALLGQRLYQAVWEKPGETMAVLASGIGLSARQLHRPMAQLKQAGQVRSVGERHLTRYFPLSVKS